MVEIYDLVIRKVSPQKTESVLTVAKSSFGGKGETVNMSANHYENRLIISTCKAFKSPLRIFAGCYSPNLLLKPISRKGRWEENGNKNGHNIKSQSQQSTIREEIKSKRLKEFFPTSTLRKVITKYYLPVNYSGPHYAERQIGWLVGKKTKIYLPFYINMIYKNKTADYAMLYDITDDDFSPAKISLTLHYEWIARKI